MPSINFYGIPAHELRNGNSRVVVGVCGARLLQWRVCSYDGLHFDQARPTRTTHPCGPCFAMPRTIPDGKGSFVKSGTYVIGDHEYTLPQHGFLRDQNWEVVGAKDHCITLRFSTKDRPDLLAMYPFQVEFELALSLAADGSLSHRLYCQNMGDQPAPINLASHTYHPFQAGMCVVGLNNLRYRDETTFPIQSTGCFEANPLAQPPGTLLLATVKPRDWHVYNQGCTKFSLHYPDGRIITLEIDRATPAKRVVIWTNPTEGPFICLEPALQDRHAFATDEGLWVQPGSNAALGFTLGMRRVAELEAALSLRAA